MPWSPLPLQPPLPAALPLPDEPAYIGRTSLVPLARRDFRILTSRLGSVAGCQPTRPDRRSPSARGHRPPSPPCANTQCTMKGTRCTSCTSSRGCSWLPRMARRQSTSCPSRCAGCGVNRPHAWPLRDACQGAPTRCGRIVLRTGWPPFPGSTCTCSRLLRAKRHVPQLRGSALGDPSSQPAVQCSALHLCSPVPSFPAGPHSLRADDQDSRRFHRQASADARGQHHAAAGCAHCQGGRLLDCLKHCIAPIQAAGAACRPQALRHAVRESTNRPPTPGQQCECQGAARALCHPSAQYEIDTDSIGNVVLLQHKLHPTNAEQPCLAVRD